MTDHVMEIYRILKEHTDKIHAQRWLIEEIAAEVLTSTDDLDKIAKRMSDFAAKADVKGDPVQANDMTDRIQSETEAMLKGIRHRLMAKSVGRL